MANAAKCSIVCSSGRYDDDRSREGELGQVCTRLQLSSRHNRRRSIYWAICLSRNRQRVAIALREQASSFRPELADTGNLPRPEGSRQCQLVRARIHP